MRIHCLIDNTVRNSIYWGEHGLCMLIEHAGSRILYDTGGSGEVLEHNLDQAGIQPGSIDAVVLSHNHRDHTGGLGWLLERHPAVPVYAHPAVLEEHFTRHGEGTLPKGLTFDLASLAERLILHKGIQEVLPGIHASGEIQPRPHPEGRSAYHMVRSGGGWIPDPYLDDQALILKTGQGLVLVCGCCHAGLLNTLEWVEAHFGQAPETVVGGLHLKTADQHTMTALMVALEARGIPELYPNHCTGEHALVKLMTAFPDHVHPFPAGSTLTFDA